MNVEALPMEAWEFFLKAAVAMIPFMYLFYLLGKACGRDEEKIKKATVQARIKGSH